MWTLPFGFPWYLALLCPLALSCDNRSSVLGYVTSASVYSYCVLDNVLESFFLLKGHQIDAFGWLWYEHAFSTQKYLQKHLNTIPNELFVFPLELCILNFLQKLMRDNSSFNIMYALFHSLSLLSVWALYLSVPPCGLACYSLSYLLCDILVVARYIWVWFSVVPFVFFLVLKNGGLSWVWIQVSLGAWTLT